MLPRWSMKKLLNDCCVIFFKLLFIIGLLVFSFDRYAQAAESKPIFIVGQDTQAITDYCSYLQKHYGADDARYPDGFMIYTAINDPDPRGLSTLVDHGAGINYADGLIRTYPNTHIIQIGLYMREMLKATAKGNMDENITHLGQWIKNSKQEVYLRIGYEFDNPENGYDPDEYIQAYHRIADKLRAMNLPNLHLVWHTIAWRDKDGPAYAPLKWYPGDRYVDWVGISFFDLKEDKERIAAALLARKLNKPLMIAESSPFKQYSTSEKLRWIRGIFKYINDYDVRFLSYINVNWDMLPMFKEMKWGDARLQRSSSLMEEWRKELEQFRAKSRACQR